MSVCIFCLRHESRNVVGQCTYGMHHEYPQVRPAKGPKLTGDPTKLSTNPVIVTAGKRGLCTKCGLHPKNPASSTNGCAHEYPNG